MTAGKRYKWHGSTIQMVTAFTNVSPTDTISAITQARPAVATEAAHGRIDGDVIKIANAAGMTEINDQVFCIQRIDANSYRLLGSDTRSYGAYTSGGKVYVGVLSQFCEVTDHDRSGQATPDIDATTICSEAAENEQGLPDFGTTTWNYNFAPRSTFQRAVADFYNGDNAGNKTATRVTLPNSGGFMVQICTVQNQSERAGNGQLWKGTVVLRNTGPRRDFDAA